MPRITVWAVRLALLQFVIATSLGAAALLHRAFPGALNLSMPPGAHAEVALMGFMLPFAFGVATWILPRRGPLPELALGFAFLLLHAGVLLVVSRTLWPPCSLAGRFAQAAGLVIMMVHILPRVRAVTTIHPAASTKRLATAPIDPTESTKRPPGLPGPTRSEGNADDHEQHREDRHRDHVGSEGR